MDTKIKVVAVLILAHLAMSNFLCSKKNCTDISLSFDVTTRMFPDKDSILLGDTIWLLMDVPTKLMNRSQSGSNANMEVDYSGATNLGFTIDLQKFDPTTTYPTGLSVAGASFKTYVEIGDSMTPVSPGRSRSFRVKEEGGRFLLKAGIIPLEKGDFMIGQGDASHVARHNDCTKAYFSITLADTDQHLYLYEKYKPDFQLTAAERMRDYVVRVK